MRTLFFRNRRLYGHPPAPLTLVIGRRRFSFAQPREFEFGCAGRTAVPAAKFGELMRQPAAELRHEAEGIRQVEKQLVTVLERGLENPATVAGRIRDLGVKLFSKDHGWRDIMAALALLGPEHDEYKKIALVKYLQYLAARQDLLGIIHAAKTDVRLEAADDSFGESAAPAIGAAETMIFDLTQVASGPRLVNAFERLPRGETVEIRLPRGKSIEILLSRHPFKLVADGGYKLVDAAGHEYPLGDRRGCVGRHAGNDIAIDNAYRSVSRKHLIVEPQVDRLLLTDISAHGTFVPPQFVHHTVH
ncbi:MAG: FHA domain-containing protein [Gammaproteobacteria bacterium]|nr:FHA domain-containing protein [Gammaproteobacteria bacterium]